MHRSMLILAMVSSLAIATTATAKIALPQSAEAGLKAVNEAFKSGNSRILNILLSEDHLSITPSGRREDKKLQLESLKLWKIESYTTNEMTSRRIGPDTILFTYVVEYKGTFDGTPLPKKLYATAIFTKQKGGLWQEVFYQETLPLEK